MNDVSAIPASAGTGSHDGLGMKLEVVVIPVSDVDAAKRFYARLGWRLDADVAEGAAFRAVQFTPPGSPCSVHFGIGITTAPPGSARGQYLVVCDIEEARVRLFERGILVSDIYHRAGPGRPPMPGPDPTRRSYASFASFKDPDGNEWLLQEVTSRLPGRVDLAGTNFASVEDLAGALRRAAVAHGEHEARMGGRRDENWVEWYARYLVAERSGREMPT